jgi:hypothetical protein
MDRYSAADTWTGMNFSVLDPDHSESPNAQATVILGAHIVNAANSDKAVRAR